MSAWLEALKDLLDKGGARVTFDPARDIAMPCWYCGRSDKPRKLVQIGCYLNQHRDPMVRPACNDCQHPVRS